MKLTFIGGGNMASALIRGLDEANYEIRVSDPSEAVRERMQSFHSVTCFTDSIRAIEGAEIIILAVKPQVMPVVLQTLSGQVESGQLVISIAAGIPIASLRKALGEAVPVIRTMPNTPALVGCGITGLYAAPNCSEAHRANAERIMRAGGETVWLPDEGQLDVVTAVSGSGPAYFFLLTEALTLAGAQLGLDEDTAARLAASTAFGAGSMIREADVEVAELRRRVTSPGGTTQAALEVFQAGGFTELVREAVNAATSRGRELSRSGESS